MKGPYERLKYDGRRVWECPCCNHRDRAPGTVTSLVCKCQINESPAKRVMMRLVDEGFRQYVPGAGTTAFEKTDPETESMA